MCRNRFFAVAMPILMCMASMASAAELPSAASNASPAHRSTDASVFADLNWTAGTGATSHDVYFGTVYSFVSGAGNGSDEFEGNQTSTTFAPGQLETNTVYYTIINFFPRISFIS